MTSVIKQRSYACRCSNAKCQSRLRLPKHPDLYLRGPRCHQCNKGNYRIDKFRDSGREHAGKTCRCGNYSFPHRKGSLYCMHSLKLTAEMMQERYESRAFA